jgi:hypothetical protein
MNACPATMTCAVRSVRSPCIGLSRCSSWLWSASIGSAWPDLDTLPVRLVIGSAISFGFVAAVAVRLTPAVRHRTAALAVPVFGEVHDRLATIGRTIPAGYGPTIGIAGLTPGRSSGAGSWA